MGSRLKWWPPPLLTPLLPIAPSAAITRLNYPRKNKGVFRSAWHRTGASSAAGDGAGRGEGFGQWFPGWIEPLNHFRVGLSFYTGLHVTKPNLGNGGHFLNVFPYFTFYVSIWICSNGNQNAEFQYTIRITFYFIEHTHIHEHKLTRVHHGQ